MAAYLVLLLAVFSRLVPHLFHTTSVGFTAVGGGLLFFGSRRSRPEFVVAAAVMALTDYLLTTFVYSYPFHASAYLVTWAWYAAVCLLGFGLLSTKRTALRVGAGVLASATSFFLISNFMVWAAGGLYSHNLGGLGACYVAALPFYGNDLMSTGLTAGVLFGLPALARVMRDALRGDGSDRLRLG